MSLKALPTLPVGGHVRAAAEVEPVALRVDLEVLARRNGVDELDLERLALLREHALGLSRLQTSLVKGLSRATISPIRASNSAKSSGWKGSAGEVERIRISITGPKVTWVPGRAPARPPPGRGAVVRG
jgi:hypothetical protein